VTTTILLARHGETDWNREGRIQGHLDPPLNERGREQACELAARLDAEPLDALYASDLRRALETADLVAARKRLSVTVEPGLREADMGSWSGLTATEIQRRYPAAWRERLAGGQGHDGEAREAFHRRVVEALRRIASEHPGQRVLVIAHGGVIRTTRRHVDPDIAPALVGHCEVSRIAVENGTIRRVD
jgi:2,3-bisphosphoglycerate-dependent phosphoglycerate mutase